MIAISTSLPVLAKVLNVAGVVFAPAFHCLLYGFRYAHYQMQKYNLILN